MDKPICPYCESPAEFTSGDKIYPHRPDLSHRKFYACFPCEAWVGCHPNTEIPLGRLAKEKLRYLKMRAHTAFDPLWRYGKISRSQAYKWLSQVTGIPRADCHIGMMDEEQCQKVISAIPKLKSLIKEHYDDSQSQRLNRARNNSLVDQLAAADNPTRA